MADTPRSSKQRMVSGQTAENCVFVALCCILAETLNGYKHPEQTRVRLFNELKEG